MQSGVSPCQLSVPTSDKGEELAVCQIGCVQALTTRCMRGHDGQHDTGLLDGLDGRGMLSRGSSQYTTMVNSQT